MLTSILTLYFAEDGIRKIIVEYARYHFRHLILSAAWNKRHSPSMYAAPDHLWIEGKSGRWMDPFNGATKKSQMKHNGWLREVIEGEDFYVNELTFLRVGEYHLSLESTQWDQWSEAETLTVSTQGQTVKVIEKAGTNAYVLDGAFLWSCSKGRNKCFVQHPLFESSDELRSVPLPCQLLTKEASFGYNAWTVVDGCLVAVADGRAFVRDTRQKSTWVSFRLGGKDHGYASISCSSISCSSISCSSGSCVTPSKECYILSGGALYSLQLLS